MKSFHGHQCRNQWRNQWKSMDINGHQWISNGNPMNIMGNLLLYVFVGGHAHFCCIKLIRLPFFGAKAIWNRIKSITLSMFRLHKTTQWHIIKRHHMEYLITHAYLDILPLLLIVYIYFIWYTCLLWNREYTYIWRYTTYIYIYMWYIYIYRVHMARAHTHIDHPVGRKWLVVP